MSKKTSEWEKEFYKVWNNDSSIQVKRHKRVKAFISDLLAKEKMELVERIEGMKVITMIPPSKFGDGKPTQVPTSEWGKGYNQALDDIFSALKSEEKEEVGEE